MIDCVTSERDSESSTVSHKLLGPQKSAASLVTYINV